ncbi:glutamine--tRNA ligase/YqeY domain fusion protein [endosymbiont of unidentified scaly snail isolate Monju]|uniref:glutamine--tRNA ligase/YqeY domain fusion protein n=1 Tax=endosymbiont of unidentified scaly snail isolate Monju TaxID=1248727 RepID=UPI0003892397|nr:glutamine--tRNA ligase/YqeY domain fusion protein [endosymbiont of unidentified scaly snail isolate Monju]BAN69045.1 glutaminyl-tRNA synthetase [endosymbiont of unidentified scaly snail isolate Monju]
MSAENTPKNFIRQIIDADLAAGKHQRIVTRFPPEPNGYLHIGHAKSIVLNFGIAEDYAGRCNLRFDDTNPAKEEAHFVEAIQEDVRWLGYQWSELHFASEYFEQLYGFAVELIEKGLAYVCDLSPEEVRAYRGTLTEPGRESPWRNRSVEENLDLFRRMREGEFPDGSRTLRARIDMASPNMNLRDPALYRIRHGLIHHQTGDAWCIYPMYDFTHPISDAIEGVTHSLCTLEFEDHRPLYDWVLDNISIGCHPQQIEFARLNLEYTVMSKRKLTQLVDEGHVSGWDDPRMPTIAGLRRRGYTPEAIRDFCNRIGVTRADSTVEMGMLESAIRSDLDARAPRRMAVLQPLKLVIVNWPEDHEEILRGPNHPKNEDMGTRELVMTREGWIDRDDFREEANKKYKRLVLGGEVRLRNGYVVRADEVVRDEQDEIVEVRCTYDPETLGRNPEGRKVRGVIHWVPVPHAVHAQVRLYDRLFRVPQPGRDGNFLADLNPDSLCVIDGAVLEPSLGEAAVGERFQFEREGYFCRDTEDAPDGRPVFNQIVSLRDSWGG